ncbi:MAG TPA: hypothetical protein VFU21_04140 [Kofleriaceae bacterium]|nr:hypothetical protein [Kofleriaceae bacterium]
MTRETWIIAALVAVSGCRCGYSGQKRELGLARAPGSGDPVVVVDRPVEGGGGGGASVYSGPMTPEAEPNDVRDKAGALSLPGGIEGSLASPTDIDFYAIEAGAARVVNVRLTGPAADAGGNDLVLTLYDGDGKPIAQSDRGPAGTLEALPNVGLAQGAAHFVSVSSFAKKEKKKKAAKEVAKPTEAAAGEKPPAPGSYRLTAEVFRPAAGDEAEPNDDPAGAREVLLDEEMTGWAGWSKDRDHWKLNLAGFRGGYVLDLGIEGVEGIGLTAELIGDGGKPIATRKSDKGRGLRVRGLLPPAGARHWLVRLSGSRSNPEVPYKLKTTARELAEGDEAEPNDDGERAITVGPLGDGQEGERRGYLDGGDVDAYKLEGVREPLSLTLSVAPPAGVDVSLRVMSGAKEVVKADTGKAGAREEVDVVRLPAGESLLVLVGGTALGDEPDPYVLRWSTKADLGAPPPTRTPPPDEATPSEDPYE